MRHHSRFAALMPRIEPHRAAIVSAEHLVAARLEPAYSSRFEAWLDLTFAVGERTLVVPFVQIDAPMLNLRESSPFLWSATLDISEEAAGAIEALIEPWLVSHALAGSLDSELLRFFTGDEAMRERFQRARDAGFLGAAPVERVLVDAAPCIYARRFARGRRVAIRYPEAAYGAALLAAHAQSVHADLGSPERNAFARAWYGLDAYGEAASGFDVFVTGNAIAAGDAAPVTIAFARPAFPAIATSFDPEDSAAVRSFTVRASEAAVRAFAPSPIPRIGGSQGRIGVVVREDAARTPEADTEEAGALAQALGEQGFSPSIVTPSQARPDAFDLLHCFGFRNAAHFVPLARAAKERGVPIVVTPHLDDPADETRWGEHATHMWVQAMFDDVSRASLERGVVERRLSEVDGYARGSIAYDPEAVKELLALAGAAIVASESEERQLRERFGYSGPTRRVPSVARPAVPPEPVGALRGVDEYVLLHATFEPRANQSAALRAAAEAGVPLVVVGSVENGDYYQNAWSYAGAGAVRIVQTALSAGQLEALYAGARVYLDVAWSGRGSARIVRAAGYGCGLVLSNALAASALWSGLAEIVDPASTQAIATGLRHAWERAPNAGPRIAASTAQNCDPLRSLQAVLGAYAEAAG